MECIRELFSVCFVFLCREVAVGVGGSDERDQLAPAQTAPQQVRFGSDRDCVVDKVTCPYSVQGSAGYRYSWVVVMFHDENQQPPPKTQQ